MTDNKSDKQFIITQAAIKNNKQDIKANMKANNQYSDEKMMQFKTDMKVNKQDSYEKLCN